MNIEGDNNLEVSQDIADMLASFSPQKSTCAGERNEQRAEQREAPRFRVKWHADILMDDKNTYRGFIKDISTHGASIYLSSCLRLEKCLLLIYVPPLNLASKPHIIEVYVKTVYVVYDGEKQLFRAAFNFIRFHPESDRIYLGERLTKHQIKIPEFF